MIEKNQKKTFSIENLNEKIILCNNCSQNISGSGKSLITLKEGTKNYYNYIKYIQLKYKTSI